MSDKEKQYNVNTERFWGPLDKLLELVENKKLDINMISLAEVTGDFLSYAEKMKKDSAVSHTLIADFLLIASKLLLIKSKVLIPALPMEDEDEEDAQNLEIQLKIYKEIKEAKKHIYSNWYDIPRIATRNFLMGKEIIFFPPALISKKDLYKSFKKVIKEIEKFRPVEKVKTKIINLQTKIKEIMDQISKSPVKLLDVSKGKSKAEVIAMFLAALHLIKEELAEVKQAGSFGEINIKRKR